MGARMREPEHGMGHVLPASREGPSAELRLRRGSVSCEDQALGATCADTCMGRRPVVGSPVAVPPLQARAPGTSAGRSARQQLETRMGCCRRWLAFVLSTGFGWAKLPTELSYGFG